MRFVRSCCHYCQDRGSDNSPGYFFFRGTYGAMQLDASDSLVYSIIVVHLLIGNAGSLRTSSDDEIIDFIEPVWEHLPFKDQRNLVSGSYRAHRRPDSMKLNLDKWAFTSTSDMVNTTNVAKPSKTCPGRREDTQTRRQKRQLSSTYSSWREIPRNECITGKKKVILGDYILYI